MIYRHSSTFCIFALVIVAATALWITSFVFTSSSSSSPPLSGIGRLGQLAHGEIKASSVRITEVVASPTGTPLLSSAEDGDGDGRGEVVQASAEVVDNEAGEEGGEGEVPLRFEAFGDGEGGEEEEQEKDEEKDEAMDLSDVNRFAAEETMGRDGSAGDLRVEGRRRGKALDTALSTTGTPTAAMSGSDGSDAVETPLPLQQSSSISPSTSLCAGRAHERLRLPERAPLQARAERDLGAEKMMLEESSAYSGEKGIDGLEQSFRSDATTEDLATGDEGIVISDPFGYDNTPVKGEEDSTATARRTYRSSTSSQAKEPSSTPRAPNSYQPALIAQSDFSDPWPLPHAYKQLHEHVTCMSGCIEKYGPRCLDGMLGCICTYLPSTTAANLTACVRFTCPSAPFPSLSRSSSSDAGSTQGDLHEGLKLVLMESARECWKYGYWIVPKPDELVMSPEERESLKRKKEKEKEMEIETKKKKAKGKGKERVGLSKRVDASEWNEEDENPQHRGGEDGVDKGTGDDDSGEGGSGSGAGVVGSGGHGAVGQDGDGGDGDDNGLDGTATPAHTIGPGGTIVSPKQVQQQGQGNGQKQTSGSKANRLVGQLDSRSSFLMIVRLGLAMAVTVALTTMLVA